jgi:hypothetical protein
VYDKGEEIYIFFKRDLMDYEFQVRASEAPLSNQILRVPDPFETSVAEITIFDKEIFPINDALELVFGENVDCELQGVRLAVGSKMSDFITVDETDLTSLNVEPTLRGLADFVENNREGLIGFVDRKYEHDRGNIIFLETVTKHPSENVKSIEIKILTSLQQRGLFMQKDHQYFIPSIYVIIRAAEVDEQIKEFLSHIDVDWEMIDVRRDLSISNWTEIECERSSKNLKGYIRANFPALGYIDINNIIKLVVKNQLNFKVAVSMTEFLDKFKRETKKGDAFNIPLTKAEIAAAAKLAGAYYGVRAESLQFDPDVSLAEVQHFEDELTKL